MAPTIIVCFFARKDGKGRLLPDHPIDVLRILRSAGKTPL